MTAMVSDAVVIGSSTRRSTTMFPDAGPVTRRPAGVSSPRTDGRGEPVHIDPRALSASLEGLGSTDIGAIPVEAALERVMGAARGLFAVSGVGLMLVDDGGSLRYVLGSDPAAQALEQAQEDLVEGPCVDSFVLADPVRTDDLITDPRWPRLGARLAGAGVRAVLGVPTPSRGRAGGLAQRVPRDLLRMGRQRPGRDRHLRRGRRGRARGRRRGAAGGAHRGPAPGGARPAGGDRARRGPAHGPPRHRRASVRSGRSGEPRGTAGAGSPMLPRTSWRVPTADSAQPRRG